MNHLSLLAKRMAEARTNVITVNAGSQERKVKGLLMSYDESDLGDVKGIGEETQRILFENGIYNQKDLKEAGIKGIGKIKLPFFAKRGINSFLNGIT